MITIFTPTYNRKKELERLYESLLNQDYDDFEWLIVDDGSIDDTEKYVNSLIKKNEIKIKYFKKENGGKPSAYNKGLDLASGNIFLAIDSDDVFKENSYKLYSITNGDLSKVGGLRTLAMSDFYLDIEDNAVQQMP